MPGEFRKYSFQLKLIFFKSVTIKIGICAGYLLWVSEPRKTDLVVVGDIFGVSTRTEVQIIFYADFFC